MFAHAFGQLCRGRRIHTSGHSDFGNLSNRGASSNFTRVYADTASAACPSQSGSLAITSVNLHSHLVRRRALFSKYRVGSRIVFYNVPQNLSSCSRKALPSAAWNFWGIFSSVCAFASGAGKDGPSCLWSCLLPDAGSWRKLHESPSQTLANCFPLIACLPPSFPRWLFSLLDSLLLLFHPLFRSGLWGCASLLPDQYDVLLLSSIWSSLVRYFRSSLDGQYSLKLNRILYLWLVLTFQDRFRRYFTCC